MLEGRWVSEYEDSWHPHILRLRIAPLKPYPHSLVDIANGQLPQIWDAFASLLAND